MRSKLKLRMTDLDPSKYAGTRAEREEAAIRHGLDARRISGLYFLKLGDHVKIGYGRDIMTRARTIQAQGPIAAELIGWLECGPAKERELHQRFKHLHERNEWFRLNDELWDFIGNPS